MPYLMRSIILNLLLSFYWKQLNSPGPSSGFFQQRGAGCMGTVDCDFYTACKWLDICSWLEMAFSLLLVLFVESQYFYKL